MGCITDLLLLPVATGMALTLCLLALKRCKPKAKYIILLRIDQKTCIKCIYTAGLEPLIANNTEVKALDSEQGIQPLQTDLAHLHNILGQSSKEDILCIMSVTSCFAPREPDDAIEIGKIARSSGLFHVVNNAYGLQCAKTTDMLNKANSLDLVDVVVQSTDKNFLVPVGGSLIFSANKWMVKEISESYPGRASSNCVIDMFITLTSLGRDGLRTLMKTRKRNFELLKAELEKLASEIGEHVVVNKRNKISMALTLHTLGDKAKDFGAWLFNCGVMGARVVTRDCEPKSIVNTKLENFGGHVDGEYAAFPYITVAAAIGCSEQEIADFIVVFKKTYCDIKKKPEKAIESKIS